MERQSTAVLPIVGQQVSVFTANMRGMQQHNGKLCVVESIRHPITFSNRDRHLPAAITVLLDTGERIVVPEGCTSNVTKHY